MYTVGHGDTLWQIAQTYLGKGSRYTEIVKLNGLKSNMLKIVQALMIPKSKYRYIKPVRSFYRLT